MYSPSPTPGLASADLQLPIHSNAFDIIDVAAGLALAATVFWLVRRYVFPSSSPPPIPTYVRPEPVPQREYTLQELHLYDGNHRDQVGDQLLIAIDGKVYDVSKAKHFYEPPDAPYCAFVGHDATLAMAKTEVNPELLDRPVDFAKLNLSELKRSIFHFLPPLASAPVSHSSSGCGPTSDSVSLFGQPAFFWD